MNTVEFGYTMLTMTITPVKFITGLIEYYDTETKIGDLLAKVPVDKLVLKREAVYLCLLQEWNEKFNIYCQEHVILP